MPPQRPIRVLIADDHREMADLVADHLAERGFSAVVATSGKEALARLEEGGIEALVTDLRMVDMNGLDLLASSLKLDAERPVIVMTAYGAVDTAVEAIRMGASHYLTKPFKLEELEIFLSRALAERGLQREAQNLRRTLAGRYGRHGLVARSGAMASLFDLVERVAPTDVPVLILGETGSGKGAIAKAIHAQSPRSAEPFVAVNCAALPEQLLESELFGHEKGAFTGATRDRGGLFAEAEGGTLLLDEIGEMPAALQAKLLHVLEHGAIRPVGSSKERRVDVRVIAATHRDLGQMVKSGLFREDLLYRLDVVRLEVPPLRQRMDDLPELIEHFLQVYREKHPKSSVKGFTPEAMTRLSAYRWPGNVRELAHLVQRLVVLGREPLVSPADLPSSLQPEAPAPWDSYGDVRPVRDIQRAYAAWAYQKLGGSKAQAAEALGIDVKTLTKWLSEP
ncbi:MAG TPA: sigma-54 dependent transcriptional regulator [Holophagaceae bacterium]|nr:sigma-54 dependent transcriptional regulator [Holophagaceae bacterium]